MCGIVAATGPWTRSDITSLMERAADRGPHGWGVFTSAGRHVGLGKFSPDALPSHFGAGALIGHTRLATCGNARDPDELQPLAFTGCAIAHNGTVPHPDDWAPRYAVLTANDSEILGAWLLFHVEQFGLDWRAALCDLARQLTTPYALAIWTPTDVWLMRRTHPLYTTPRQQPGALRFACSRPWVGCEHLALEDTPVRLAAPSSDDVDCEAA